MKKRTPIVQPDAEKMETPDEVDAVTKRPRETRFFLLLRDSGLIGSPMFIQDFGSKTDIREYFSRNPMHTIENDFIIRGYKKPLVKTQSIRF